MHALLHSVLPAQQQATTDPCLRCGFLDTPWQVWVSLLWGHYSFLLGTDVYKFLFMPSKSLTLIMYVCIPLKWGNLHNSEGCLPLEVRNVGWEGAIPRQWRAGTTRQATLMLGERHLSAKAIVEKEVGAPSRSLLRCRGPTSESRLREPGLRLNQNQASALPSSEPREHLD